MVAPAALLSAALAIMAVSPRGAVATGHPLASEAGAEVLRAGGNAVDAAVAAAFALSVVEPASSGIGGGGFAVVYLAQERRVRVLDFRETAPGAASAAMFLREGKPVPGLSLDGGLAVAVPGAVRGYAELARRFGTRPLSALTAPAARLAARGFPVGRVYVEKARDRFACLASRPAAAREFLARGEDGRPALPEPGWRLRRADLARTLEAIGRRGPEAFHRGPLAARIAAAVRAEGGLLTEADLAGYATVERAPVEGRYRGRRLASAPLPSAGGAMVVALLQGLEAEAPRAGGYRPERFLHAMIELQRRLFAWRAGPLGDPAFAAGATAEVERLLSPEGTAELRRGLGERAAAPEAPAPRSAAQTSHLSVVDGKGNAVALTTTVNALFGSCVLVPGTGILLNDQMDDFEAAPGVPNVHGLAGSGANAPAPGKRPLSSMSPTLVFGPGGEVELAVGAAGGGRIPTAVAQVISHLLDDGMRLDEALAAPRLHRQFEPDAVLVEPNGLEAATAAALGARGHRITFLERAGLGNAQAVRVDPSTGWREGAGDPRQEGAAAVP
jgi:gamma-glutamyltranspeptidase/glutathione hydrolase